MVNLDHGMHLFGSSDHGENWFLIDTKISPANESKIVELSDGRWMINSRVNGSGHRYVHISSDKGMTWNSFEDEQLIDPGCNATILNYQIGGNEYLFFANAAHDSLRQNLTIKVSNDLGENWDEGKVIYPGETAYSTMTILENNDLGLVFEKDNYSEITFVRLPINWLING